MADDRDPFSPTISTASSNNPTVQSKRPGLKRHNTDVSQLSDQSNNHHRSNISKNQRHGHGHGHARVHARVPSSSKKFVNRRQPSPPSPERPPMIASAHHSGQHHHHRRATSEVKLPLPRQASSAAALKKNSSHTNLGVAGKRNRSHVEIAKRPKPSAANLKRSSSHKEVNKLKGVKSQVHFDLGDDNELDPDLEGVQDDEWVDASNSASPYLSRRGSVVSTGQSSTTREDPDDDNDDSDAVGSSPSKPHTPSKNHSVDQEEDHSASHVDRETIQHKEYITSRLLKRTPSSSAPPKMTAETASVRPKPSLPESRRDASGAYGTPRTSAFVGSGGDELTSRFVSGSGPSAESGSFCTPTRSPTHRTGSMPRPRSLANLEQEHRDSISDGEGDSALAPRTRRPAYKPQPAEKSRTQQKLNLQRASSSIEPAQPGGGAGVGGVSPLVGGSSYDNRDPRVGKLLERTGMEYLVVIRSKWTRALQFEPEFRRRRQVKADNSKTGSVSPDKRSGFQF
ncbi:hypothetical protein DL768_010181 [Monosporascus sp. mg162]|nr:hypothetical protein DL768_010181 [Monosporascus sp. mg162]